MAATPYFEAASLKQRLFQNHNTASRVMNEAIIPE